MGFCLFVCLFVFHAVRDTYAVIWFCLYQVLCGYTYETFTGYAKGYTFFHHEECTLQFWFICKNFFRKISLVKCKKWRTKEDLTKAFLIIYLCKQIQLWCERKKKKGDDNIKTVFSDFLTSFFSNYHCIFMVFNYLWEPLFWIMYVLIII